MNNTALPQNNGLIYSKIKNYFTKIASYFTKTRENKAVVSNLHPEEQVFFVGFSLKNEPIYRDSKAWANHQEWLKSHKSGIAKEQGALVLYRTAKEAKLLELPSQAQIKYSEQRNQELSAAQEKSPGYQKQKELCRQLFANLPAYVEEDDEDWFSDDKEYKPKKPRKTKRKVESELSPIPIWEVQQAEKARKQKKELYRSKGFDPDAQDFAKDTGANPPETGWPDRNLPDENGPLATLNKTKIISKTTHTEAAGRASIPFKPVFPCKHIYLYGGRWKATQAAGRQNWYGYGRKKPVRYKEGLFKGELMAFIRDKAIF